MEDALPLIDAQLEEAFIAAYGMSRERALRQVKIACGELRLRPLERREDDGAARPLPDWVESRLT
ncbi:MAG: hypothetical protein IRZ04_21385 [Rhodospirillales bacterium]|nr:hypothetical protein [Rhodospirillales bacterium]